MRPLNESKPPVSAATRIRPGKRRAVKQVLELQQLVFQKAHDKGVKAAEVAALARAWDSLANRIRILRGQPLPGSLAPKTKKSRPRSRSILISDLPEGDAGAGT